jgi:hypothetical protein
MDLNTVGRWIALLGAVMLLVGGGIILLDKIGIRLGQLPGDIRIETETFTCVVPIVTSILISLVLTIGLNLLIRLLNK